MSISFLKAMAKERNKCACQIKDTASVVGFINYYGDNGMIHYFRTRIFEMFQNIYINNHKLPYS
jgi:hypothetical protein